MMKEDWINRLDQTHAEEFAVSMRGVVFDAKVICYFNISKQLLNVL